ncbi:hypothetical protein D3C73_1607040 [compost metagenome]
MLDCSRFAYSGYTHNDYIRIGTISAAFPWVDNNEATAGVFSQIIAGAIVKPAAGEGKSSNKSTHWHDLI